MHKIPEDYIQKVYAGWLGKIIGVRYGAPIEMWTYEKIGMVYGELDGYVVDYKNFAADDDSNGPMIFLRSLEDYVCSTTLSEEQIGLTWLNYAPYEHGFYWWGGYGKSTEHTAYLNLRNGINAPRSGSISQNGAEVAEQIGGQIFIDTWGLVAPGNVKLAAHFAEKAASVSHDGNGKYGGMFIAACISAAFTNKTVVEVIKEGLSVIPADSTYAHVVREVMSFYEKNPHTHHWRNCFQYIKQNFWTDKYTGNCHIIPNAAIIILALLYGDNDFDRTLNICNMCGFDTDCNVANVGTIMGVLVGLENINFNKWRQPINDFLACSCVIGCLNIQDIPSCSYYIAKLAYQLACEPPEKKWADIFNGTTPKFNFELPGSTHAFRIVSSSAKNGLELKNSADYAYSGERSLKIIIPSISENETVRVFYKTYYSSEDFSDSRYDPSFSPVLYPGQTIAGNIFIPGCISQRVSACMYVRDKNSGIYYYGDKVFLTPDTWHNFSYKIPTLNGACIEEAGFNIIPDISINEPIVAYVDDIDFYGSPDYSIDFKKEKIDVWYIHHKEVSQFTYLQGIWTLEDGQLSGSCQDIGEAYTGCLDWRDYSFTATVIPQLGDCHNINFRVQGAIRSYALGLSECDNLILYKNNNGYIELISIPFKWKHHMKYTFKITVVGSVIKIYNHDLLLIDYTDENEPYLNGQIGISVLGGSHCHYEDFIIQGYN